MNYLEFIFQHKLIEITVFFLVWLILWLPIALPVAKIVKWSPWQPFSLTQKLAFVGTLYVISPLVIWLFSKSEEEKLLKYGLSEGVKLGISLIEGFGLGILGLLIIFSLEYVLKCIEFNGENINKIWSIFLPILILGILIGFAEELIFRGFFLTELNQNYQIYFSAIISSLIFAILHLIWEQKETLPQIPGLFLMGIILVIAVMINDGNIGLAWGLHSSWIFGLTVIDTLGLIVYKKDAPEWLIGVNKQPLAGVSGLCCLLLTGGILLLI